MENFNIAEALRYAPEDTRGEMIGTALLENTKKIMENLDQIYALLLSNYGRS